MCYKTVPNLRHHPTGFWCNLGRKMRNLSSSAKFSAGRPPVYRFSATMASTYSTYHLGAVTFLKFLVVEKIYLELRYSCVLSTRQCDTDSITTTRLVMVALWNRADHYIFILFLSSFFLLLFLFPRLISAVGDWMSTILPQMVWP